MAQDEHPQPEDIPTALLACLDSIEIAFRRRFGLDLEYEPDPELSDSNRERFENSLAKVLLQDVMAMVASDTLLVWREKLSGDFPIGDLARNVADFRLIRPQIRLDLARADVGSLEKKAQRTVDLLGILLEEVPSGRAPAYLQRVARCYVEGLDPECLVMCRAVLDSVFEEAVSIAEVRQTLPSSRIKGSVQLAHRIEAAERLGKIDAHTAWSARSIKDAGNDAIHSIPVPAITPLEAIHGTLTVLKALL